MCYVSRINRNQSTLLTVPYAEIRFTRIQCHAVFVTFRAMGSVPDLGLYFRNLPEYLPVPKSRSGLRFFFSTQLSHNPSPYLLTYLLTYLLVLFVSTGT